MNQFVKDIQCGFEHTVFLTAENEVYACGSNKSGQLGIKGVSGVSLPTKVPFFSSKKVGTIACGYFSTFFLTNDLPRKIYACGGNDFGQLCLDQYKPNIMEPQEIKTLKGEEVKSISCGSSHTLLLTTSKSLFSCGLNDTGQLGLGDTTDIIAPKRVPFKKPVVKIAAGAYFSYLLTQDGELFSTGRNDFGQLGVEDVKNRHSFTKIKIPNNEKVALFEMGHCSSFILSESQKVYFCGSIAQLGVSKTKNVKRFKYLKFPGLVEIKCIASKCYNSYFIDRNFVVYSCGNNVFGQRAETENLGKKLRKISIDPTEKVELIRSSGWHTFFFTRTALYCCGRNNYGQLGVNKKSIDCREIIKLQNKHFVSDVKLDKRERLLQEKVRKRKEMEEKRSAKMERDKLKRERRKKLEEEKKRKEEEERKKQESEEMSQKQRDDETKRIEKEKAAKAEKKRKEDEEKEKEKLRIQAKKKAGDERKRKELEEQKRKELEEQKRLQNEKEEEEERIRIEEEKKQKEVVALKKREEDIRKKKEEADREKRAAEERKRKEEEDRKKREEEERRRKREDDIERKKKEEAERKKREEEERKRQAEDEEKRRLKAIATEKAKNIARERLKRFLSSVIATEASDVSPEKFEFQFDKNPSVFIEMELCVQSEVLKQKMSEKSYSFKIDDSLFKAFDTISDWFSGDLPSFDDIESIKSAYILSKTLGMKTLSNYICVKLKEQFSGKLEDIITLLFELFSTDMGECILFHQCQLILKEKYQDMMKSYAPFLLTKNNPKTQSLYLKVLSLGFNTLPELEKHEEYTDVSDFDIKKAYAVHREKLLNDDLTKNFILKTSDGKFIKVHREIIGQNDYFKLVLQEYKNLKIGKVQFNANVIAPMVMFLYSGQLILDVFEMDDIVLLREISRNCGLVKMVEICNKEFEKRFRETKFDNDSFVNFSMEIAKLKLDNMKLEHKIQSFIDGKQKKKPDEPEQKAEEKEKAPEPKKEDVEPKKEEIEPKKEEIEPKKEEIEPKKEEIEPPKEEPEPEKEEEFIPKKEEPKKEPVEPKKEEPKLPKREEIGSGGIEFLSDSESDEEDSDVPRKSLLQDDTDLLKKLKNVEEDGEDSDDARVLGSDSEEDEED